MPIISTETAKQRKLAIATILTYTIVTLSIYIIFTISGKEEALVESCRLVGVQLNKRTSVIDGECYYLDKRTGYFELVPFLPTATSH